MKNKKIVGTEEKNKKKGKRKEWICNTSNSSTRLKYKTAEKNISSYREINAKWISRRTFRAHFLISLSDEVLWDGNWFVVSVIFSNNKLAEAKVDKNFRILCRFDGNFYLGLMTSYEYQYYYGYDQIENHSFLLTNGGHKDW